MRILYASNDMTHDMNSFWVPSHIMCITIICTIVVKPCMYLAVLDIAIICFDTAL
jgi:hypothetical protein